MSKTTWLSVYEIYVFRLIDIEGYLHFLWPGSRRNGGMFSPRGFRCSVEGDSLTRRQYKYRFIKIASEESSLFVVYVRRSTFFAPDSSLAFKYIEPVEVSSVSKHCLPARSILP